MSDLVARRQFIDRAQQPFDVFRTRQSMIAVLHEREHDIVLREAGNELHRVRIGNVRVLHPLQNANRATELDRLVEQEMLASVLDQRARDRIGRIAISGRPQPRTPLLDFAPAPPARRRPTSSPP
jgi:hypothetical protein